MEQGVTLIGFGEAGRAFAQDLVADVRAYDRKTYSEPTRRSKLEEYRTLGVDGKLTNQEAVEGAAAILSCVTADKAVGAARETARTIEPGAFYFDMNSVAPSSKRDAAGAIEHAGGRYVDVAIMAPVLPTRLSVPLLVSGPHADAGASVLIASGFRDVRTVEGAVGAASAIKMIRSVMIKGMEALTTECILAAEAAGVRDPVLASLEATWPGADWSAKANYNLDRMMVHGLRRASEMEEVVKTLNQLRTGSAMSRGTVERQRAIGALHLAPPETLDGKLAALLNRSGDRAA